MAAQEPRPLTIDFIDPLFAVAIHVGFTHGPMQEAWFEQWRWPQGDEAFNFFALLLGFITIAWSWVGYHQSIAKRPFRVLMAWRFVVDIVVVLMYIVVLVQYRNFGAFLLSLALIYFLYVLWDLGKVIEGYPWGNREYVSVVACMVFVLIWAFSSSTCLNRIVLLTVAYVGTVAYRLAKLMFAPRAG